nr:hypothetical protein [uncultured Mediterranean phage uvMED]
MKINKKDLKKHRDLWIKVAKKNGWYKNNFCIQIWIDLKTNKIIDSVSFVGLNKDIICDYKTDRIIK